MSNIDELRKQMIEWTKENYKNNPKVVYNQSLDEFIEVSFQGVKHTIKSKNLKDPAKQNLNQDFLESIPFLEELIQNGEFVGETKDKKSRNTILKIKFLANRFKNRKVKITIRELLKGNLFYDHRLEEDEKKP